MKRLPTKEEFEALLKLPYRWNGKHRGIIFTADNGNKLFFSAFAYNVGSDARIVDSLGRNVTGDARIVDNLGYYWSATPYSELKAWYFYFHLRKTCMSSNHNYYCYSVRLVSDTPCDGYIDMGAGIYWAPENYTEDNSLYFTWKEAVKIQDKVNGSTVECDYPNYNLLNQKQNSIACTHVPEEHLLNIPESIPINWEQRRYEIAKAVLGGLSTKQVNYSAKTAADIAVVYADALIDKLKEKNSRANSDNN